MRSVLLQVPSDCAAIPEVPAAKGKCAIAQVVSVNVPALYDPSVPAEQPSDQQNEKLVTQRAHMNYTNNPSTCTYM